MEFATHTITRGGRQVLVAGRNPRGPRGGTSGNFVDGRIVAQGRAVRAVIQSSMPPDVVLNMVDAIGRPLDTGDRFAFSLLQRGDLFAIFVAIQSGRLQERTLEEEFMRINRKQAGQAKKDTEDAKRRAAARAEEQFLADTYAERLAQAVGGVKFDGQFFAAERLPAGSVRVDRALLDTIRAIGVRGQVVGLVYSRAQQIAGV